MKRKHLRASDYNKVLNDIMNRDYNPIAYKLTWRYEFDIEYPDNWKMITTLPKDKFPTLGLESISIKIWNRGKTFLPIVDGIVSFIDNSRFDILQKERYEMAKEVARHFFARTNIPVFFTQVDGSCYHDIWHFRNLCCNDDFYKTGRINDAPDCGGETIRQQMESMFGTSWNCLVERPRAIQKLWKEYPELIDPEYKLDKQIDGSVDENF